MNSRSDRMNDIYYQLLRHGCIDKAEYNEKKSKIEDTLAIKTEYINELEEKNRQTKQILIELHEEEVKILDKIKQLLDTEEFKRAYTLYEKNIRIDEHLKLLENDKIECTKGKKELKRIRKFIEDLIEKQRMIDDKKLHKIKKQVGSKIWDDFQHYFQSHEFLNFVNREESS